MTRGRQGRHGESVGTNYYLEIDVCPHCGHCYKENRLHIGKSSGGWCFSLHVMPECDIHDLDDWLPLLDTGQIVNEYGDEVTVPELLDVITNRHWADWEQRNWELFYRHEAHFHERNHSERGPNGLLRHQIGRHCVKHGAGTWDCLIGYFS